tara:strand:- start:154 stop:786 length:633 start_codon:yes stop_codon:yes gene_type:complete
MKAIVKANQVIDIISSPKAVTIDGTAHPKEIFIHWERQALVDLGIYDLKQDTQPDTRFETGGAVSYSIDNTNGVVTEKIAKKDKSIEDVKEVDEKGKAILDENGNQVITKGLKSIYIESIKQQANSILKPSDWLIHRFVEDNTKKIPDDVKTYRKKVRDTSDTIITKIQATKTLSDLKKLFNDATIKDGKITTPNTMDSMPVSTIQEYER